MAEHRQRGIATLAQLGEFDAILDARSPAEFADDHVPGATSCPVLSDEERARVGTLYKQVSPFEAKKVGAALVAKNIAAHIEAHFLDKPKSWRPLVYCWRGGQRSGAFTHILREIGWDAHRLDGGYKTWRRQVVDTLATLPQQFSYKVISGPTGSAKSRILEALGAVGINIEYAYCFVEPGGQAAIDVFRVDEIGLAVSTLAAEGIRVLGPDEVYIAGS